MSYFSRGERYQISSKLLFPLRRLAESELALGQTRASGIISIFAKRYQPPLNKPARGADKRGVTSAAGGFAAVMMDIAT